MTSYVRAALFAAVSVAFGIVAWIVLPRRVEPTFPVPPTLTIDAFPPTASLETIDYDVSGSGQTRHVLMQFLGHFVKPAQRRRSFFPSQGW